jgi:hypothetical protein
MYTGDTTLAWTEQSREKMVEFVKLKMEQGFSFYLIEPRFSGILPPKETKISSADDLPKTGALKSKDQDLLDLIIKQEVQTVKSKGPLKIKKKVSDPKEVVESNTLAVKNPRGG